MNEKFKSSLGLAAIILGIGIAWLIIGKMIRPMIKNDRILVQQVYFELETNDINESTEFYEMLFPDSDIDSISVNERIIRLNNFELSIIQVKNVFRSKLNIKVKNLANFESHLKKNEIIFRTEDSKINFYDPDTNLIVVR